MDNTQATTAPAANPIVDSISKNLIKIAESDGLKGFLPVLDNFLTALTTNQAGLVGAAAAANAVGPTLAAAAPQVGAGIVKDEASALKTGLDAAAAKAQTSVSGG